MAKDKSHDEDGQEGVAEGEEGNPKKGKKGLILIVVGLLVLLIGGGAGLYFSGMLDSVLGKGTEEAATEETAPAEGEHEAAAAEGEHGEKAAEGEHGEKKAGKPGDPVFVDLPEFLVNLNTGTGRGTSFLKATVTLDLPSEEAAKRVEAMKPRIVDSFNTYLRELRTSDLAGSAGINRLREELMMRINKAIEPEQVNDVLFKEIVVQ